MITSFRENFFFFKKMKTQIITHIIHPIKDIHHCRNFSISIGLFMKYSRSYINTCHNLHHIKTHRMSIMNSVSRSFFSKFCKFLNF